VDHHLRRTTLSERLEALEADASTGDLLLGAQGLGRGKHVLHVEAKDGDGTPAVPARVAVWVDPVAPQWSDGILYQVMIDRFRGDDGAALAPPPLGVAVAAVHVALVLAVIHLDSLPSPLK